VVVNATCESSFLGGFNARQPVQRVQGADPQEVETHVVRPPQRKLLEHCVRRFKVGHIEHKHDTSPICKRIPLIDPASEVKIDRFANFVRHEGKDLRLLASRVDSADGKDFRHRRSGLDCLS